MTLKVSKLKSADSKSLSLFVHTSSAEDRSNFSKLLQKFHRVSIAICVFGIGPIIVLETALEPGS